ncbi:MAG: hypothetical protein ACRDRI_11305 [Pseudonocardiaceae bacterium]
MTTPPATPATVAKDRHAQAFVYYRVAALGGNRGDVAYAGYPVSLSGHGRPS